MPSRMRACLTGLGLAAAAVANAATAPPPLAPETLKVEAMPAPGDHWIYLLDLEPTIDARLGVFDLDKQKLIGQRGAGMMPGVAQSTDRRFTYAATTYFSRGSTGERTDVLEITDNQTLLKTGEVVLPPKHAQQIPSQFNTTVSDDGGFAFVTNVTPATSVTVVDLAGRKVASEVDTAACVLAYPSGPLRFTSLCESGKALTVTVGKDGKETHREQSERFIDVENDPVFTHAQRWGNGYLFLSFGGKVTPADFSASPARFDAPWPLVSPQEVAEGWRPGGQQPFAVHRSSGRLYVAMHKGGDGSHKEGGTEIWVFDLKSHARIARWPVTAAKLLPVLALTVTQDPNPVLVGATGIGLQSFDASTGKLLLSDRKRGHAILQVFPF